MVAQLSKILTPDEYLTIEVVATDRHEYRDGVMIKIAGGTPNHNDIGGNFYIALKTVLRQKPYRIFYADQRLCLPDAKLHTYPDVIALAKPIEFQRGRSDTVMNAIAIVEILSDFTQDYDRGDKFTAYKTMPDFQDYLLVSQTEVSVEHYEKTNNNWQSKLYTDRTATITLTSLGVTIGLEDLYEGIEW